MWGLGFKVSGACKKSYERGSPKKKRARRVGTHYLFLQFQIVELAYMKTQ